MCFVSHQKQEADALQRRITLRKRLQWWRRAAWVCPASWKFAVRASLSKHFMAWRHATARRRHCRSILASRLEEKRSQAVATVSSKIGPLLFPPMKRYDCSLMPVSTDVCHTQSIRNTGETKAGFKRGSNLFPSSPKLPPAVAGVEQLGQPPPPHFPGLRAR